jgi:transcriptional regulator with XRE-family HTH domain
MGSEMRTTAPVRVALRELMDQHDLTQIEVAAAMEVDQSTVSRLLKRDPRRLLDPQAVETFQALATAFHLAPTYFREYRIHQLERAMETHPELVDVVYDIVMSELGKAEHSK